MGPGRALADLKPAIGLCDQCGELYLLRCDVLRLKRNGAAALADLRTGMKLARQTPLWAADAKPPHISREVWEHVEWRMHQPFQWREAWCIFAGGKCFFFAGPLGSANYRPTGSERYRELSLSPGDNVDFVEQERALSNTVTTRSGGARRRGSAWVWLTRTRARYLWRFEISTQRCSVTRNMPTPTHTMGWRARNLGQMQQAMSDYTTAIRLSAVCMPAYAYRFELLMDRGDILGAGSDCLWLIGPAESDGKTRAGNAVEQRADTR